MIEKHDAAAKPITYPDRRTEVKLGDRIRTTVWWFWKHEGRVIHIPGISPFISDFEHDGLRWVGIRLDEGGLLGVVIDPEGNFLLSKRLVYLGRDESSIQGILTRENELEEGGGGWTP